jgi:epoxyqueuosine reductase
MNLKEEISEWLGERVDAVGFAPVSRFDDAPEQHHPSRICKNAATVIVFGKTIPRGMLRSPDYNLYIMQRAYHSMYPYLDELGLALANRLEAAADCLAVPVPSYAPLVFHGREPWGLLSLKHAAVRAGLGSFGNNGLMHHPRYGTLLRLGAVVTSAELPGDPMIEDSPCLEKCKACFEACPSSAFDETGTFRKMTCLAQTIKHAIYPIAFSTEEGRRHIERVVNTAGNNYWLACDKCLSVCPSNRNRK